MFTHHNQRGISLIELIMFIVIVSIALTGILLGINQITGHSSDTLLRKQALTAAESVLEQIESESFPATSYTVTSSVSGLTGYSETAIVVVPTSFPNILVSSAALITVVVTDPTGQKTTLTGYQINN